jgi:hypothetical protein
MRASLQQVRRASPPAPARLREVRYYNVLRFATPLNAVAFCRQVADFLAGADGTSFMAGAHRATLWIAPTGQANGSCFVFASDGALDAARLAGAEVPIVGYAHDSELPASRCLFFGDTASHPDADRRMRSASLLALCMEAMAGKVKGEVF